MYTAVDCGSLPEVKFTINKSYNCKNSTLYGTNCIYNCQQGYNFGKNKYNWNVTCLANASWSFVPTACQGIMLTSSMLSALSRFSKYVAYMLHVNELYVIRRKKYRHTYNAHTYTFINTNTYVPTRTRIYAHTHTHTHTRARINNEGS